MSLLDTEIRECPTAVARAMDFNRVALTKLAAQAAKEPPRFIATCGRGSSAHALAFAGAAFQNRLGIPVLSLAPSTLSLFRAPLDFTGAWFVIASQSGRSPDLIEVAAAARKQRAFTIGLVNDAASPLAAGCDLLLPLAVGPEASVAATKSCLATAALGLSLAACLADEPLARELLNLPALLDRALATDWAEAIPALAQKDSLFLLGRGPGLAVARELGLKLQELGGYFTRAISPAEILHGPIAAAGPTVAALILAADDQVLASCVTAYEALQQRGAGPVWLGDGLAGAPPFPAPPHGNALLRYLGLQLAGYQLASDLARARGRDPDRPSGLQKITRTL